jgi:hypothetical protein
MYMPPVLLPWSSDTEGREELALVACGGGSGRNRPDLEKISRRRLGFRGENVGAGLDKGEEEKEKRSWEGSAALSPHGQGGGPAALGAPYPAAKPRSPRTYDRPLHSCSSPNEIGNYDFAPGGQGKPQGNHRAALSATRSTKSPRSLSH